MRDVLVRLMEWMETSDIDDAHIVLRDAITEIVRLRVQVEKLRQHRCLWGNDPSGPYVPDEYIDGVARNASDRTGSV